jgi:hypothetical protein
MGPVRIALAVLLLASCGSRPPARSSTDEPAPQLAPVEAAPAPLDVSGWKDWPKTNARRFRSKGHGYLWVDVHVDGKHQAAYADRGSPSPVGFAVVMAGYETLDAATPTGLTVMAKMPPGYDAANNDWYYAVYDAAGQAPTLGGKVPPCVGCHVQARARDFLYGVSVKDDTP